LISVAALTPTIGAIINGVELTNLDDATFEEVHRAWMKHLVVFFPRQRLSLDNLEKLGNRFGRLRAQPAGWGKECRPGVEPIHTDAHSKIQAGPRWHSDLSCRENPPIASILYLHQIPKQGGDTLFANLYAAYDDLSGALKDWLRQLRVVHTWVYPDGKYPDVTAEHDLIKVHPVTGKRVLFVNESYTSHIVGLSKAESDAILTFLYQHIAAPRFQCRFSWQAHTVALWDNRCTQHMAIWDYYPETRSGYRATVSAREQND